MQLLLLLLLLMQPSGVTKQLPCLSCCPALFYMSLQVAADT